ncbi:MAG: UPF0262 family protein [Stappiaceae bacterium]
MDDMSSELDAEKSRFRLIGIELDEKSIARANSDVEHERAVAIFDLIEENSFQPVTHTGGPYRLKISLVEKKMVLDVHIDAGEHVVTHILSLTPFRKIVKDYFLICESYYEAIKTASPSQIEAIDMGRRGVHNDGSELLQERLKGKIDTDMQTARRLFTLICALHWKG